MHSFCDSCEQTKKELNDSKARLEEFQNLAKKIVQIDILFQKYSSKENECNLVKTELTKSKNEQLQLNEKSKALAKENEIISKKNKALNQEVLEIGQKLDEALLKITSFDKEELALKNETKKWIEAKHEADKKIKVQQQTIEDLKIDSKSAELQNENLKKEIESLKKAQSELKLQLQNAASEKLTSARKLSVSPKNPNVIFSISSLSSSPSNSRGPDQTPQPTSAKQTPVDSMFFLSDDDDENDINLILPPSTSQGLDTSSDKKEKLESPNKNQIAIEDISLLENSANLVINNESMNENDISSSSSASSSSSSSSSSSESSDSDEPPPTDKKTPISKLDEAPTGQFGFDLSDEELTDINMAADKNKDELFDTTVSQFVHLQEENALKDLIKQAEDEAIKEKLNFEDVKFQRENEKSTKLVDELMDQQADRFLEEFISRAAIDYTHCEFYCDKLVGEEVRNQARSLANAVLEEERAELRLRQKQLKLELREKLMGEAIDSLVDAKVDSMIQECCERVLIECRKERLEGVYYDLLEDTLPKLIEKELFQVIFEEMNPPKPALRISPIHKLIEALEAAVEEEPPKPKTTPKAKKRPLPSEVLKLNTVSSNKKPKTSGAPDTESQYSDDTSQIQSTRPIKSEETENNRTTFEHKQPVRRQQNFKLNYHVKELLAEYMRAYNFKASGFSFDKLDAIINKIDESTISSKAFAIALAIHYINNKFIPLDEQKTNQQELYELNLYKDLHTLLRMKEKMGHTSNMHLAYKQNKVDKVLGVKTSNEEEKYVYLIKKLVEKPNFRCVLDEFLAKLKVMILSADFTDHYNYRIGRMICFLCKETENFQFLRCFIYDLVTVKNVVMPLTFHKIIILFARIWPDILQFPFSAMYQPTETDYSELCYSLDLASSSNPILCAIIFVVKKHMNNFNNLTTNYSNEAMHAKYYSYILETLCNWSLSFTDTNNLLKEFQKDLSKLCERNEMFLTVNEEDIKLTPIMFEYMQSFKLLCVNEGWEWTADIFLKVFLRKVLEDKEEETKRLLPFYLLVQGIIIAQMCPKSSSATALEAMASYEHLLSTDNSFLVQCACVESLLHLAPFDPTRSFSHIQSWLKRLTKQPKVPASLESKLKYTYEFYKKQLPNSIVILI